MASTAVCGNLASLPRARFVKNPVIVPRPALCLFFVVGLASPNSWPGSVCGFGTHCLLLCELLFRLITRWRPRRKLSPVLRLFLILLLLYLLVLLLLLLHLFDLLVRLFLLPPLGSSIMLLLLQLPKQALLFPRLRLRFLSLMTILLS